MHASTSYTKHKPRMIKPPPPPPRCAYIGFQMFIHPKRRISAFLSTAFTLRAGGEKSSEHIPEETHIGYISV